MPESIKRLPLFTRYSFLYPEEFMNTTLANGIAPRVIDGLEYLPFIESDAKAPAEELRARMSEQGYLFFRGLVPTDEVLGLRREVLQHCAEAGWLDPNYDISEGIVAPGQPPLSEGIREYAQVYRKVLRTPRFHDFPAQLALVSVMAKLLGAEPFIHPRRIGRITFPKFEQATTPAHQDYHYIRGSVETYSCWMPLGDCPIELGGLAVAPGSQHRGFLDHNQFIRGAVGGQGVSTEDITQWHTSDFAPGDALFFHSYTIHKAMPNRTENRLRVSTDNRYQRAQDDINPDSLKMHGSAYVGDGND
jgi:ectoine hydroxylase-related dioxygenase (phytanoyl-CoA dioxygenase family)